VRERERETQRERERRREREREFQYKATPSFIKGDHKGRVELPEKN
jgi:hypothetical protein